MSFPRYQKYKSSGAEWLGQVPEHWKIDRLKRSVLSVKNGTWGEDAKGDRSDIPCVRVADFNRERLCVSPDIPTIRNVSERERRGRMLKRGNLLLEKSGGGELQPVGAVALYDSDAPAVCSNFVAVVALADGMVPSFWRYLHAAAYSVRLNARSIKQTSGIQNLDQQQYFDEVAPFPPVHEQGLIAKFLDVETSKIDALIAEQERLIELLKEKRQAVISHGVTKGVNEGAVKKHSGVQWIGEIPQKWTVCEVRRVVNQIEQGWSPECLGRHAELSEWGVLKTGCVNYGRFAEQENKALPDDLTPATEYEVRPGDVIMSRANGSPELVGSTAIVESVRPRLMLSDKLFRFGFGKDLDPRFFVLIFNARYMRAQIERAISGAEGLANNLPQSALKSFVLALPPMAEQGEIVKRISAKLQEIDRLGGRGRDVYRARSRTPLGTHYSRCNWSD